MPLTPQEEAECLRFLGYANWQDLASSYQLGVPSPAPPEFLVRDAFVRINEQGINLVRRDLQELRCIEEQMSDSRSRLKATQIGNLKTNQNEFNQLRQHFTHWQGLLADDLGVYPNPISHGPGTMSSRNARVC